MCIINLQHWPNWFKFNEIESRDPDTFFIFVTDFLGNYPLVEMWKIKGRYVF